MDQTKEYIKMCKEAYELQKLVPSISLFGTIKSFFDFIYHPPEELLNKVFYSLERL